jgi:hypothetical protein
MMRPWHASKMRAFCLPELALTAKPVAGEIS